MKEEIQVEVQHELRVEIKASREAFERDMRKESRYLQSEKIAIVQILEHSQADIDDLKKMILVELAKNEKLKE